jgi:hypothetical protein
MPPRFCQASLPTVSRHQLDVVFALRIVRRVGLQQVCPGSAAGEGLGYQMPKVQHGKAASSLQLLGTPRSSSHEVGRQKTRHILSRMYCSSRAWPDIE